MLSREWLFRLVSLVAAPLLFLGAAEAALRLAGYGHDTRFFVETPDGEAWTTNHDFGRRFFSAGFQIHPEPVRVPKRKPPGELRVVLLGGSAAYGDLDPATGLARFLEAALSLSHPDARLRVVSAALPGANSHLMRRVARDARVLEPDLVVVYLGNNEMVGPFGPGSWTTNVEDEAYVPAPWRVRVYERLSAWRVGQLLGQLVRGGLGTRPLARAGPGGPAVLRELAADDPRVHAAYATFEANLAELLDAATRDGAAVLLCTVAVNLRDFRPLASLHGRGLGAGLAEWERLRREGRFLAGERRYREAADAFRRAEALDDAHAELAFELAGALAELDEPDEALAAFARARDLDAIRSRADSELNARLRRAAEGRPRVELADVERALARPTPGRRLFYDGVHLTPRGNDAIARRLAGPAAAALGLPAREPPALGEILAELPVTAWDRHRIRSHQARRGRVGAAAPAAPPPLPPRRDLEDAAAAYARRLERAPEDLSTRERLANVRLALGEPEVALREADRLVATLAGVPRWHRLRGRALAAQGRVDEALAALDAALAIDAHDLESRVERAALRRRAGDTDGAVADLEAAVRIAPGNAVLRARLEASLAP